MGFTIVIAGQSQCNTFTQICLVADYLSHQLPDFCYEKVEKTVQDWKPWLSKQNKKNQWHHVNSPIIWKELLIQGSKPYYIGGASNFLSYCHSYYKVDLFLDPKYGDDITRNLSQYNLKMKREIENTQKIKHSQDNIQDHKNNYIVTISGGGCSLVMHLISGLLDMSIEKKNITKIYIHDDKYSCLRSKEETELECNYVRSSGKVVKSVEKLGIALTHTDLLIVLNHEPFNEDFSIGDWLIMNKKIIEKLALVINASACRNMRILFANLGPACYNATILINAVTNIPPNNIVVATTDLGLDIAAIAGEIAEIPMRNMYCPPVWGFVGINHLVDIKTTIHVYNTFEPYKRCTKVENSSLTLGKITPEMRTLEYLMHFDESLWIKVAEMKDKMTNERPYLNKAVAVLNLIRMWLFDTNLMNVVSLGTRCDGTFGLHFNGVFSQPCQLVDDIWKPAGDFLLPKDHQIKLPYLEKMTNFAMNLSDGDLPKIVSKCKYRCKLKGWKGKSNLKNKAIYKIC